MKTAQKSMLGNIKRIKLVINSPLKMNCDIEYKNIALFVGTNASGKTLVMKFVWAFTTYLVSKIAKPNAPDQLSFILDHSIKDHMLDGTVELTMSNCHINCEFSKGVPVKVETSDLSLLSPISPPIFMSKDSRLFSDYDNYYKLSKILTEQQRLDMFPLYDIVLFEIMRIKFEKIIVLPENIKKQLEKMEPCTVPNTLELVNNEIVMDKSLPTEKKASLLSAGEQALINMSIVHV